MLFPTKQSPVLEASRQVSKVFIEKIPPKIGWQSHDKTINTIPHTFWCFFAAANQLMNNDPLLRVKCFLLDMDGTFNLGDGIIDGSLYFIDTLNELGIDYLFLTNNSSKHRGIYAEKITRLGLPTAEERVFTAGEATALYLAKEHPSASVYVVGTPALEEEFSQHGFQLEENNPQLIVLGFDTTLTYQKLWKLCDFVRAGLPYIATHPDFNCPTETGYMPDIGAMIAFVRAATGREPDLVVGKPNRMIVDAVAQKYGLSIAEMAMVGDRLYTDIALGQTSGITTCLVLSGETTSEDLATSPFQPTYTFTNLGAIADWLKAHTSQ